MPRSLSVTKDKESKKSEGIQSIELPIGKKLLFAVLVISTIVTTTLTSISFYIDYTSELDSLDAQYENVKKSFINSLTQSLWNYDTAQIKVQADGILSNDSFLKLRILDKLGNVSFEKEKSLERVDRGKLDVLASVDSQVRKTVELQYKNQSLGTLELTISKDSMYRRLQNRLISTFVIQFLKTLIVSASLLAVFHYLLTVRVIQIFNFLSKIDVTNPNRESAELKLTVYRRHKKDEIDYLAHTVRQFVQMVLEHYEAKDRELNIQKAHALQAARLASLGEMAGGIAHEINNPLGILRTNIQLIDATVRSDSSESPEPIDAKEIIELTESSSKIIDRIAKIIRGLRSISRDSTEDPWSEVTLNVILDDVLGLCVEKFKSHGVQLILDLHEDAKEKVIHCSSVQLAQVLINLINNAYDAIEKLPQKWVKIAAEYDSSNQQIVLKVSDSGLGIPANVQEKLFAPFFTTKEIGKGTGLGLSIARSIIERHHGSLSIDNNNPNTCFVIALPESKGQTQSQAA